MAYNNGFPINYPQYYPQYQQSPPQPQPQPQMSGVSQSSNPMIWVQGETGAKSYLLAPNTTLPLWDSEAQVIYLKSADASGMPSMKILDYRVREQTPQIKPVETEKQVATDYVTHSELDDFEKKIIRKIDELNKEDTGA